MSELYNVIQTLIEEGIPKPNFYSTFLTVFKYESYYKWTLDEIRRFASCHPGLTVETMLDIFIKKMENESCYAKDPDVKFMFSTAEDTATYVLDRYISYINTYYKVRK